MRAQHGGVGSKARGISLDRLTFVRRAFGTELPPFQQHGAQTCFECHTRLGESHQLGCDCERCPQCEGQLVTCLWAPSPSLTCIEEWSISGGPVRRAYPQRDAGA